MRRPNQGEGYEGGSVRITDPDADKTKAREQGGNHKTVSGYKEYFPNCRTLPQGGKHVGKDKSGSSKELPNTIFSM